ncbi:hypothetical protein O6H91_Y498200 [Diphasiastrum complanatum]|nr:hypothetical protein O6H91_Y498200 [Diphasiastrum complanatum]
MKEVHEEDGEAMQSEDESEHDGYLAEEEEDDEDANDSEGDDANGDTGVHNGGLPSAFGRAFGKIMKKPIPTHDTMGPVLAAQKHLIAKKLEEESNSQQVKSQSRKQKRALREVGHVLPQSYIDTKEIQLIRLATKGVVTLFNAVNKAQRVQANLVESSGRTSKGAVKQSKAAFLAELRGLTAGGTKTSSHAATDPVTNENENKRRDVVSGEKPGWTVLQDNFMLGRSTLKEWDKKDAAIDHLAFATGVNSDTSLPHGSDSE